MTKGQRLFKGDYYPDSVPFQSMLTGDGAECYSVPQDTVSICVLSTGDELTEPGEKLEPGKIFDSNRTMLKSLLKFHGFDKTTTAHVRDT